MAKVVVYSQPSCMPCNMVKNMLDNEGIDYIVKDIRADEQALKELQDANYNSTPVTFIKGKALVGYNPAELTEALKEVR